MIDNKVILILIIMIGITLNSCTKSNNSVKNEQNTHSNIIHQKDIYGKDLIEIDLEYPKLDEWSNAAHKINQTITNSIFTKAGLEDITDTTSYKSFFNIAKTHYQQLKKNFQNSASIGMKQKTRGKISTFTESILSIYIETYIYTGGAHGMEYREYLNFDPVSGEQVDILNYVTNKEAFVYLAETKLREKLNMETYDEWSEHAFLQEFKFPKNIGMTDKSYILIYNQYELLSYSEGHTEIEIDFIELK